MRFVQFKPRLQALITARIAHPSSLLCPTSLVTRTFAAAGPAPLALVKELRLASGAPITDCKKALEVRLYFYLVFVPSSPLVYFSGGR